MPQDLISQFDRKYALPIETYRQVQNLTQRDAIPAPIRWEGMMCYVLSEGLSYVLTAGMENSDWVEFGALVDVTVVDDLLSTSSTDALSANQGRVLQTTKLSDAPSDGNVYGRLDGAWAVVGGGAVDSVFGRTGAVVAQTGDYTFAQIGSKPTTIGGYGITDFNSLGDARWLGIGAKAADSNLLDGLDSTAFQTRNEKGTANGYTPLDSGAKVPIAYLPDSVIGQVQYQGTWAASSNTPTLANPPSAATKGHYYVASNNGTQFGISFQTGDWIISNGAAWEKVDNTDAVTSVFGRIGAVVANAGDYTFAQIGSKPTTLAGYGITDAVPTSRTLTAGDGLTGGGSLAANRSFAVDGTVVRTSGTQSIGGAKTFTSAVNVPDQAYGSGWNGSTAVPTRNAIYDKIESMGTGAVSSVFGRTGAVTAQNGDYTFAQIGSTPTTLSGYGITDAVPTSRTLTAGDGLTGGGNLTANRSFAVDSTVVRTSGTQSIGGAKTFTADLTVNGEASFEGGRVQIRNSGQRLRILGTGTGNSNSVYIGLYESNGTTRQGYIGFPSTNNDRMYLRSDQLNSHIYLTDGTNGLVFAPSTGGDKIVWHSGNLTPSDYVPTSRTLTAGDGLTGGGSLAANRSFDVDGTVVRTSGTQSIGGAKTFTTDLTTTGTLTTGNTTYSNNSVNHGGAGAAYSFLNGTTAWPINTNNLLVSNNYSDRTNVPTNGAYVKGNIVSGGSVTAASFKTTNWEIVETGGVLQFKYGGVVKFEMNSSGVMEADTNFNLGL